MGDLLEIAEQLRAKAVPLQMLDPAMDTSTAAGELIFHVFGAVASFERKLLLERQREGIAKARVESRYTVANRRCAHQRGLWAKRDLADPLH